MAIDVTMDGVEEVEIYFRRFPQKSSSAARLAINTVATRKGLTHARRSIEDEVAFPAGYLRDRLTVTKKATTFDPEAIITGRKRATSLARFAQGKGVGRKGGVRIRVKKGKSSFLRNAWLVRLKRGASLDEDNYNIGLAVRLGPGETLQNKKQAHQSWLVRGQVALLYGPSVDQVFRTVSRDIAPDVARMVGLEFIRQFNRL